MSAQSSLFPELEPAPAAPAARGRADGRGQCVMERRRRPEVESALYWREQLQIAHSDERRQQCHAMWLLCIRALSSVPDGSDRTTLN